jgi:glycosyltransferase involved in cell wall biosynthesis
LTNVAGRMRERLRRARFALTPVHARPTQVLRALGRTRLGNRAKALRRHGIHRYGPALKSPCPRAPTSRPRRGNVLIVSHCDFTGNSAYHAYSIAMELARRGWSPAIAVPGSRRGVRELGKTPLSVVSFRQARRGHFGFASGDGPDLVHAFTPRRPVRRLTFDVVGRTGCPYVVHLEDNEMVLQRAFGTDHDAEATTAFLEGSAGVTAVIDRLLELKPERVAGAVMWPGYDEAIDGPLRPRDATRRDIGLERDVFAVVYTGNVHEANIDDVCSLYRAIGGLRARDRNVVLVKCGWNSVSPRRLPRLGRALCDLGWIKRRRVFELLTAADVLVQPGAPGLFNDYRFPSKLPDFLASGVPVILPATNVGLELNGDCAVILRRGDHDEIAAAIAELMDDPDAARRIGSGGRSFARERLTWARAGHAVEQLYRELGLRH